MTRCIAHSQVFGNAFLNTYSTFFILMRDADFIIPHPLNNQPTIPAAAQCRRKGQQNVLNSKYKNKSLHPTCVPVSTQFFKCKLIFTRPALQ